MVGFHRMASPTVGSWVFPLHGLRAPGLESSVWAARRQTALITAPCSWRPSTANDNRSRLNPALVRPLSPSAVVALNAESAPQTGRTLVVPLGDQKRGFNGVVVALRFDPLVTSGVSNLELERRLLEMGFVEGARVEIVHEGLIGRDPIAIRLDDMRVAMRRREARCILTLPGSPG